MGYKAQTYWEFSVFTGEEMKIQKESITLRVLVANEYGEFPKVAGKTADIKLELTKELRDVLMNQNDLEETNEPS